MIGIRLYPYTICTVLCKLPYTQCKGTLYELTKKIQLNCPFAS